MLSESPKAAATTVRSPAHQFAGLMVSACLTVTLSACDTVGLSSSVGPTRGAIRSVAQRDTIDGLKVVNVTSAVTRQLNVPTLGGDFADVLGGAKAIGTRVGVGDALEITIWEAAPAALFGAAGLDTRVGSTVQASRANTLPEVQVGPSGTISVPFAGQVPAAGRTLRQIEQEIVVRLNGKAHLPQAIVRLARNVTANVTVLGDVKQPMRVPLSPRGERLLDVIAQAGGSSEPLDRMTIQIARAGIVQRMSAQEVVRDPNQNVVLKSDDVVTLFYQPYSFTVLGAAGKNDEVRFEGLGLTLSQALGRIGGLQDDRADPQGVFIFRWETPATLGSLAAELGATTDQPVPVIYKVDLKQPETFFAAQQFRMRDKDVIYISNSRLSDIQRVVGIFATTLSPLSTVRNLATGR